ncbi:hypothetical protein RRG08_062605 [Elysia crispata]|uniref:Uncharacterized protein n=1 Tax=Elysia crispata TaxID=231223 RepID=A0AAE0YY77_9GAST|nr:hypothetical protein RRG08_062605 [Elysia crispata]
MVTAVCTHWEKLSLKRSALCNGYRCVNTLGEVEPKKSGRFDRVAFYRRPCFLQHQLASSAACQKHSDRRFVSEVYQDKTLYVAGKLAHGHKGIGKLSEPSAQSNCGQSVLAGRPGQTSCCSLCHGDRKDQGRESSGRDLGARGRTLVHDT